MARVPGGGPAGGTGRKGGVQAISGARSEWLGSSHSQGEEYPAWEQDPPSLWGPSPGGGVRWQNPLPHLPPSLTRLQSWEETRSLIPEKGLLEDDPDIVVKGGQPFPAFWRTPKPNPPGADFFH